jgi:hypothetical protein
VWPVPIAASAIRTDQDNGAVNRKLELAADSIANAADQVEIFLQAGACLSPSDHDKPSGRILFR